MATERRKRSSWYVGPKADVSRKDLNRYDDGAHAIEEKRDGIWAMGVVKDGVLVSMETRVGLSAGSSMVGQVVMAREAQHVRLVGELEADLVNGERKGTRRWHLFDVLEFALGDDACVREPVLELRDWPYDERREMLELLANLLVNERVSLVPQATEDFVQFYDDVVARDGEGVVVKRRSSKHRSSNASGKIDEWVRCKPRRTVDYVVTGRGEAEKGTAQLKLGLYVGGKLKDVMTVTCSHRTQDATPDGSVVEVLGHEVFPSGALRFGHMQRVRDDKPPEDCTLEAALSAVKVHDLLV